MLMNVEGIVTRCSIVRPKMSKTVHYCEATNKYTEAVYHDNTSLRGLPTGSVYPTKVLSTFQLLIALDRAMDRAILNRSIDSFALKLFSLYTLTYSTA